MQTQHALEDKFYEDIDRIVKSLINCYGLKYDEEIANLSDPLLRWQDFVARYIPPRPRSIYVSNEFPKKLDVETANALHALKKLIQSGADINPYQSKGLMLHNDTSANKRQLRTDLLWADWGIHHLHLTTAQIASESYFAARSKWLLFCIVGEDFLCLVDVREHDEPDLFSNPDLIKIVTASWPEMMERYRINGISLAGTPPTTAEIAMLRKNGISSFVNISNQVFMGPGMGVTTASTPIRVSMVMNKISRYIQELAKIVYDSSSQFKIESAMSGITDPEYGIELTPQGLAVYEKHESKAFVLPRGAAVGGNSFLAELHDLIAPEWAMNFVVGKAKA